jgi:hypothetical protein
MVRFAVRLFSRDVVAAAVHRTLWTLLKAANFVPVACRKLGRAIVPLYHMLAPWGFCIPFQTS